MNTSMSNSGKPDNIR